MHRRPIEHIQIGLNASLFQGGSAADPFICGHEHALPRAPPTPRVLDVNKLFVNELFPVDGLPHVMGGLRRGSWMSGKRGTTTMMSTPDFPAGPLVDVSKGPRRSIEVRFRPLTKAHQANRAIDTKRADGLPDGRVRLFSRSLRRLAWITTLKFSDSNPCLVPPALL